MQTNPSTLRSPSPSQFRAAGGNPAPSVPSQHSMNTTAPTTHPSQRPASAQTSNHSAAGYLEAALYVNDVNRQMAIAQNARLRSPNPPQHPSQNQAASHPSQNQTASQTQHPHPPQSPPPPSHLTAAPSFGTAENATSASARAATPNVNEGAEKAMEAFVRAVDIPLRRQLLRLLNGVAVQFQINSVSSGSDKRAIAERAYPTAKLPKPGLTPVLPPVANPLAYYANPEHRRIALCELLSLCATEAKAATPETYHYSRPFCIAGINFYCLYEATTAGPQPRLPDGLWTTWIKRLEDRLKELFHHEQIAAFMASLPPLEEKEIKEDEIYLKAQTEGITVIAPAPPAAAAPAAAAAPPAAATSHTDTKHSNALSATAALMSLPVNQLPQRPSATSSSARRTAPVVSPALNGMPIPLPASAPTSAPASTSGPEPARPKIRNAMDGVRSLLAAKDSTVIPDSSLSAFLSRIETINNDKSEHPPLSDVMHAPFNSLVGTSLAPVVALFSLLTLPLCSL
jgi:hypothetical protein